MSLADDPMRPAEAASRPYVPSRFFMARVVNPITLWLGGPTLTVRGRRTGRPIRTPVPTLEFKGARYLVSGGGETHWVRNLRAAGEGELRRGRTNEPFLKVAGGDPVWRAKSETQSRGRPRRDRKFCKETGASSNGGNHCSKLGGGRVVPPTTARRD